jgi:hypothetical protein
MFDDPEAAQSEPHLVQQVLAISRYREFADQTETMAADNINDRSFLRFPEEVIKRFIFLEALGFRRMNTKPTLVRYESSVIGINVYQGRQSYEIGLEIESLRKPTESYSFSKILRLVDTQRAESYRKFAAHTVEGVAHGVEQLAELLHECTDKGALNSKQLFSRLKLQRADLTRNYALSVQLRQAREKAEVACARKEFGNLVKILSPFQEHLNPVELKSWHTPKSICD